VFCGLSADRGDDCDLPIALRQIFSDRAALANSHVRVRAFAGATFLPIDTRPAPMVLAFAFGVALITGIVFGAAPAWFATRTDPIDALRGAGRSTGDDSSFARKALLMVQATLSVVRRRRDSGGARRVHLADERAVRRVARIPGCGHTSR